MGGFYGSVQFRCLDRAKVIAAAEAVAAERKIKCLVGPVLQGWVGVYSEGQGQDDTVGEQIARRVGGHAIHLLVHDDDILAYWLWSDGRLVDRYHSAPGYFGDENLAEEEPLVGNPAAFAFVLDPANQTELKSLLDRDQKPVFECERLQKLGELLGISNAMSAYEYLKGGETDDVNGFEQFVEVPAAVVRNDLQKLLDESARIAADRARLRAGGLLLFCDESADRNPIVGAVHDGLIAVYPEYTGAKETTFQGHVPPWERPGFLAGIELPPGAHVTAVAADRSGRRLAIAAGSFVRVWDQTGDRWLQVADIAESDLTIQVALSADGSRVAHASRKQIVVTDIATGDRLAESPLTGNVRQICFSADGKFVAVAAENLVLVSVPQPTVLRMLAVGGNRPALPIRAGVDQKLANMDVDAMIAKQRETFDKAIAQLSKPGKSRGVVFTPEQLAEMRGQMEKTIVDMRERLSKLKTDGLPGPPAQQPMEHCHCVGFDLSSTRLWVGTTAGFRVYDWSAVLASTTYEVPAPVWSFDLPEKSSGEHAGLSAGYVYAAVNELGGSGVVFGGLSSDLYRMDLATGRVTKLLTMPGGGSITGLAMCGVHGVLGVCTHFWSTETLNHQQDQRRAFEIWDFQKLAASVAVTGFGSGGR